MALFFAMPEEGERNYDIDIDEAVEEFNNYGYSKSGAAVFAMNPIYFNSMTVAYKYTDENVLYEPVGESENYEYFKGYIHPTEENSFYLPHCILGTDIDRRIYRQSGNFTIHGINVWPLEQYDPIRSRVYKIFIPYTYINEIRGNLNIMNINKESIYGDSDLDIISKDISNSEKSKFNKFVEDLIGKYSKKLSDEK